MINSALKDLILISNTTGKDDRLVQGGGGNTSVKTADNRYMYIKASGTALKNMSTSAGWRRMRIEPILELVADDSLGKIDTTRRENEVLRRLMAACDDDRPDSTRPSVEAHLHARLDRCVIHLHPWAVGAFVNARNGRAELDKIFKTEKFPPLWIPYADPGYMLARRIARMVADYHDRYDRTPAIMNLEKHGLFVTAPSPDGALRLVRKVINACNRQLDRSKRARPRRSLRTTMPCNEDIIAAKLAIRKGVHQALDCYVPVSFCLDETIASFLNRRDASGLLAAGVITPDELLYAGGAAVWLDRPDAAAVQKKLSSRIARGQKPATSFMVKGLGLFVAADHKITPVACETTRGSLFIRCGAAGMGGVATLSQRQQQFINQWESESYRQQLISSSVAGDLKNRIALVTGAGSGLGRSIAVGLARAGAIVAVADIDSKAAAATISTITDELPGTDVMPVCCNVTDENSVDDAFGRLLDKWGGLDILVNAAGIAPPFALVDLPVDQWRLALEVNLTGYFLMARAAARIMIQQAIGGNIINISSKSGIDASRDNTPYNATKAGELHMARGWAMELGEHGIRVNCVCPGNVFEGSRIWNQQYIRTCAKKYGIQPDQVIPYYVNKTALKREIKGQDIADSVIFLCSDQARTITGQTIVADSGQAMVR